MGVCAWPGNDTDTYVQEWFCTVPGQEGRYYVALRAGDLFDANGPVPGYVMYDGRRPTSAALVPLPGKTPNQLKEARGFYTVSVTHKVFRDGPIAPGESREGCISYAPTEPR